jgi:hypothetical protein
MLVSGDRVGVEPLEAGRGLGGRAGPAVAARAFVSCPDQHHKHFEGALATPWMG